MARKFKRLLVISDTQCGHLYGLTPPKYQTSLTPGNTDEKGNPYGMHETAAVAQRELWDWFAEKIRAGKPYDGVVLNGDAVEGKGWRSGATELVTPDRNRQAQMAADILGMIDAKHTLLTFGTPYHTGVDEDWELVICDKHPVDKIASQHFIEINGLVWDFKHHISNTTVPYSVHTAPTKERILNILDADMGKTIRADIVVRSHIHRFSWSRTKSGASLVTAGLQVWSKFGARRMSTDIDIGFCWFDIYDNGRYKLTNHEAELECRQTSAYEL